MKRYIVAIVSVLIIGICSAQAETFLPGDPSVNYAANMDGFYVNSTGFELFGATSWALAACYSGSNPIWAVQAGADAPAYSDAGIVLNFNGGLKLGDIASVSATYAGDPLSVNLWFDTGGDGKFFTFSGETMTSLNGDSYGGVELASAINGSSLLYMFGGNGAGNQYTLDQLKAGADSGIDANTPVCLWVGLTNGPSQSDYHYASISQIDLVRVPEPATLSLLALGGLAALRRNRK